MVPGLGRQRRDADHLPAHLLRHGGAGALLEGLLVLALHGALALSQADHLAVVVAEDLHLDVLDREEELLHVDRAVAEGGLRLGRGGEVGHLDLLRAVHPADAAAAAARARLDEQGEADALGLRLGLPDALHHVAAGDDGHARLAHGAPGGVLIAHLLDDLGVRADEAQAALLAQGCELGILGEQAVSGVDGLAAGEHRRRNDGAHVEVALCRGRGPDADALIRQHDVQGVAVRLGVDGNGGNAHLLAGADDAHGDLAAVGDQDLGKHGNPTLPPSRRRDGPARTSYPLRGLPPWRKRNSPCAAPGSR